MGMEPIIIRIIQHRLKKLKKIKAKKAKKRKRKRKKVKINSKCHLNKMNHQL
jgi:hypothetical protein